MTKLDIDVDTTKQSKWQPSKRLIERCRKTLWRREVLNVISPHKGDAVVYLNPASVEKYTDGALSADGLKELRRNKNGPAYFRVGHKTIIYRRADIDAYLAERRVEANKGILRELARPTTRADIEEICKQTIINLMKDAPELLKKVPKQ